jgi:ATP-dependent helicase STH1/SNF2
MAIPNHIERSILSVTKEQWEAERERLFHNSLKYYQAKIEKNDDFKQMIRDRFHRKTNEQQMDQARQITDN